MMTKRERKIIMFTSIAILILVIIAILVVLYMTTDMFKSSSTLFAKYIGQNIENIESLYNEIENNEYDKVLEGNKYNNETEIKVDYIENTNTTSENRNNIINKLKLKINGQTDKINNYNYQDINLLREDDKITEVKYIQNNNIIGIQFSDIFNQYVLANNENLKELFTNSEWSEEQISKIPNVIEFNNDLSSIFKFSEQEKETIKAKYGNIILNNVSKNNFSKQTNKVIQINENNINTTAYTLTVTKEQLNDVYIKILEELKQDETILSRIDKIQEILNQYQVIIGEMTNLRENFVSKIERLIDDIVKNNIGQDECSIVVYEKNKTTVKTVINTPDYEINIDTISDYIQISQKDNKEETEKTFLYKKDNKQTNIILEETMDEITTNYTIIVNDKIDGDNCERNIIASYEDNINKVEMNINQQVELVEKFENEITLNNENSVNLSELESEQVKNVLKRVNEGVSEKVEEITSTQVNVEDLRKVLIITKLMEERQSIEDSGVTEREKNRFNSKFEILQGENLSKEDILNLIDAIKNNLVELEVVSDTELKIKLDRFNKNEQLATTLSNFIENNTSRKYNAKVEYDEATGLIRYMVLTIVTQ